MIDFGVRSMKKHELLVPAGNMECLKQAVYNGCDAVYLACKSFGARKFANNFTNEEVVEAIHFCHLYGVRVFVTMNTLIKNDEVDAFIEQARFLHQNGVDALIVQDFGMICLLREKFPNLEIHASTQANISSYEVCKMYYDLGVKRVVFSREMTIEEIEAIDVPIEKEAFIHGALCISYSGECLMSSLLGGRSGNRGECAGVCRMPFSLKKDGKTIVSNQYLLSTKELNTSTKIDQLLNSSIYSFKIEGRMKSPLYVGFITNFYRHLIDGKEFNFLEETNKLKTIFNRGFTVGRIFHENDKDFMNIVSPNHIGLQIGKASVYKKYIKIQLNPNCTIHQGDAIRFINLKEGFIVNYLYDKNLKYVSSAEGICYVDNKVNLKKDDFVSKTQDSVLEKEYELRKERKIPVSFEVIAKVDKPLVVTIMDNDNNIIKRESSIVLKAEKAPLSTDSIEKQFSKLGNTPFIMDSIHIELDENVFLPIRDLNDIRRLLVTDLIDCRSYRKNNFEEKKVQFLKNDINKIETGVVCSVHNEEQLIACLENNVSRIYVWGIDLYNKYKHYDTVYYQVPRASYSIINNLKERNFVSDYANYKDKEVVGNYSLNVMNIYTAYYLQQLGFSSICLSVELSIDEVKDFLKLYHEKFGYSSFEVLAYGRVCNMIIKGNVLDLKPLDYYTLVDVKERCFPVFYDGHLTHIMNWEKVNSIVSMEHFNGFLRLDFLFENKDEVRQLLKIINK